MKKIAWYLYTALMVVSFFLYKDFKILDILDVVVSVGLVGVLILYVLNKRPFGATNVWL